MGDVAMKTILEFEDGYSVEDEGSSSSPDGVFRGSLSRLIRTRSTRNSLSTGPPPDEDSPNSSTPGAINALDVASIKRPRDDACLCSHFPSFNTKLRSGNVRHERDRRLPCQVFLKAETSNQISGPGNDDTTSNYSGNDDFGNDIPNINNEERDHCGGLEKRYACKSCQVRVFEEIYDEVERNKQDIMNERNDKIVQATCEMVWMTFCPDSNCRCGGIHSNGRCDDINPDSNIGGCRHRFCRGCGRVTEIYRRTGEIMVSYLEKFMRAIYNEIKKDPSRNIPMQLKDVVQRLVGENIRNNPTTFHNNDFPISENAFFQIPEVKKLAKEEAIKYVNDPYGNGYITNGDSIQGHLLNGYKFNLPTIVSGINIQCVVKCTGGGWYNREVHNNPPTQEQEMIMSNFLIEYHAERKAASNQSSGVAPSEPAAIY